MGVVYECLHKKKELLAERNIQIDARIDEIKKRLHALETTHALQEKELRLVYIEGYQKYISDRSY